jgi:ligand-binding sensor domain-containing protein
MLVDRENNVWIGGKTGLHRFFYSPLVKLELPSAIGEFALAPDEHGRIWVGSQNPYLYKVENGKATIFKKQEGEFACAYRAPDGTLWIGMAGVLWRMVGDRLVSVALPEPVMRGQVTVQAMTADSSGRLWVSFGRGGLYRLQTDEWIPFGGQDGIPTTGPISAFTDKLGRTWFGYAKDRLVVMERDRVQVFESKDGLHVGNVTAIYGRGPEIWIGGEFGLQQMRGKQFQTITSLNQGWLRGISGIIETPSGDLWLNGLSGIFHLARQEIATALENPSHQVKGEYYSRRKGLPGYEWHRFS